VVAGTKVFVTVSLGAEAPVKTMEQLTTVKAEEAERFLDGLEMDLNIIKYDEHSATVPVGSVTRTEPAFGEELAQGQTVRLWISTGPEVVEAEVPNVVGKSYEKALSVLEANGFKNVHRNPVDSTEEEGRVVAQSVEKYEKVEVTTLIVLDVSTGVSELPTEPTETTPPETTPPVTSTPETTPPETTPPVTESTLPDGQKQLEYAFAIPSDANPYHLTIKVGDEVFLNNMTIAPGATSVTLPLVGSGTVIYELYINDVYYRSEMVEFDLDE
jgi:serine/threonine-protein kinase